MSVDGQHPESGEGEMVVDFSLFRYERQLLRSKRRLESLKVDEAYDRLVTRKIEYLSWGYSVLKHYTAFIIFITFRLIVLERPVRSKS